MGTPITTSHLSDLRTRVDVLMARDQRRLLRRLEGVPRLRNPEARRTALDQISSAVAEAERRIAERRARVPEVTYPQALPVSQKKDEILAAIRDHQVVIVAGETGSGKTTQIPKICLELGRGIRGLIGHTQPRRIAARTVAERIAEELSTPLGEAVGWKVRFTDQVSESTLIKLMTDGILLAELQHDRLLQRYDTLIIDEAHERSLNVDFILGYLKRLLPQRPDLKVVITSATIDPERFSQHFDGAPVIEVSGRTYPVEVRYRPLVAEDSAEDDRDQVQAICDAVDELCTEGPGDILVFLSGEREIRDTADALAKQESLHRRGRATEILPLYARLSSAEQHRVFQRHSGRRVVLATNVAETSLTVPGIKYVIDPGTARISRYSHRLKVQRLPIEAISQASANQRKGRCGRVSEGICIRLYSQEDFLGRPEFTDPEILRTNLASVILQMTAIGLGDIAAFPFVEPPDRRNIKDGVQLLEELGAIDPRESEVRKRLTPLGRKLAQLPVDPRLARMVIEADQNGRVHEVMVIAAALSIQDPRERPADKRQAADEKHRRFAATGDGESSDFLAYLNLWEYLRERQRELSSNQFRKLCRAEFLNYLRVREWQDIYSQLRSTVKALGIPLGNTREWSGGGSGLAGEGLEAGIGNEIHKSLLAGLLSHIGVMDPERREYLGARGAKFALFPGSSLFKRPPRWVMSAELVETSRLWGRVNARIEPQWAESLAHHLVKRAYSEPHWEKDRGAVMAYERVTLYGVPIVAGRKVSYGKIDPELCRELFIRHALVQGEWRTHHRFLAENRALLDEVEELEHRARRRDILVEDETLFDFYDQRIGPEVVSARHFDSWWKRTRREQPDLLTFDKPMLMNKRAQDVNEAAYPDFWERGELRLPLSYQFQPGSEVDGVTAHIPLSQLNQVTSEGFDWQVPGLRAELVTALIRSLPKPIRRSLVPAPDVAAEVMAGLTPQDRPLFEVLTRELLRLRGVVVPPDAWDVGRVPHHLRVTFRVVDAEGRTLAEDKDLEALKSRLRPKTRAALSSSAAARALEREGLRQWDLGTLPRVCEGRERDDRVVRGYPALVDEGDSAAVRIFETEAEQLDAMGKGLRRLLLLQVNSPVKSIQNRLGNQAKLALSHSPYRGTAELFDDCVSCAVDKLMNECGGVVWEEERFTELLTYVRGGLYEAAADTVVRTANVLAVAHRVNRRIKGTTSLALVTALADIKEQVAGLVYPGFVTATGWRRLPDVLRYLKAVEYRLERLPNGPRRDRDLTRTVERMRGEYQRAVDALSPGTAPGPELEKVRWMIEELRVSYFAQRLGTPYPVSDKRILKAIDQLRR